MKPLLEEMSPAMEGQYKNEDKLLAGGSLIRETDLLKGLCLMAGSFFIAFKGKNQ